MLRWGSCVGVVGLQTFQLPACTLTSVVRFEENGIRSISMRPPGRPSGPHKNWFVRLFQYRATHGPTLEPAPLSDRARTFLMGPTDPRHSVSHRGVSAWPAPRQRAGQVPAWRCGSQAPSSQTAELPQARGQRCGIHGMWRKTDTPGPPLSARPRARTVPAQDRSV